MSWLESVQHELNRRQAWMTRPDAPVMLPAVPEEAVQRAVALVRSLLNQMNQTLLEGRGTVRDAATNREMHVWELWWAATPEQGTYLFVTLLRDSRGTPYVKVQERRIAVGDARFERRLQRALAAAFLTPRIYRARAQSSGADEHRHSGAQNPAGQTKNGMQELLAQGFGTQPDNGATGNESPDAMPQKRPRRQRPNHDGT